MLCCRNSVVTLSIEIISLRSLQKLWSRRFTARLRSALFWDWKWCQGCRRQFSFGATSRYTSQKRPKTGAETTCQPSGRNTGRKETHLTWTYWRTCGKLPSRSSTAMIVTIMPNGWQCVTLCAEHVIQENGLLWVVSFANEICERTFGTFCTTWRSAISYRCSI